MNWTTSKFIFATGLNATSGAPSYWRLKNICGLCPVRMISSQIFSYVKHTIPSQHYSVVEIIASLVFGCFGLFVMI